MFFGKAKMDENQRKEYAAEIDSLIGAGKSAEAFSRTKELEKLDKDAAGYFMAFFYYMGREVRENVPEAQKRIESYLRRVPDDAEAYRFYGMILQSLDKDDKAEGAYKKAIALGSSQAMPQLACLYKLHADAERNRIARTLNMREYAEGNANAISLYISCMSMFDKAFQANPALLEDTEWQGYGRAADMMYAMSLNGEVKKLSKEASSNILAFGAAVIKEKKDFTEQSFWRNNAVRVTAQMEQAGFAVMAEYFRLSLCLADCAKKKPEMMANAKWHMDRIHDLDGTLNAEQRRSYSENFEDFVQEYEKQERRHGRDMQSRLRAGKLPDLGQDYLPGQAPAVESNKTFSAYLAGMGSGAAQSAGTAEPPKKKKGLFGLFG